MRLHTVVKVTPQMLLPSKSGTAHLGIMLYILLYIQWKHTFTLQFFLTL